jgi:hypothetical protein
MIKCIQELIIFKTYTLTARPLPGYAVSGTIMVSVNEELIYQNLKMEATGSFRMSVGSSYHMSISVRLSVKCAIYTVKCAIYTVECAVYTVECAIYTVKCAMYTVRCAIYTVKCAIYTLTICISVSERFLPILWHKGEVHPTKGHAGPVGEQRYRSTLSLTSTLEWGRGGGGKHNALATLPQERPGNHCMGDWMGPTASGKSHPHQDSIPKPSSL